ncbi:hypothetical protein FHX74_000346 [Friedmanniella endophytica]|uniref:Polyketide cyclase / dehydrase and lipid transport n=1 Tax=Microlunatus kandeliicorticis TaxID=1759536 RepID=A0A7W3IPB5_9ACTN|nr:SRPBCC family protein [Microlunatus kandeliicorticis]MBA8792752.1 hypothetical protein [Microlunatus kandeliicorticis]
MDRLPIPRTVAAAGEAAPDEVWRRYVELSRWPSWAPPIQTVEADGGRLRPGLTGLVHGPAGLRVPFEVLSFDAVARTWRWRVRFGPTSVVMAHEVLPRPGGGTVATLALEGAPWWSAYLPAARVALGRLVAP